jgi:hypothetical protein
MSQKVVQYQAVLQLAQSAPQLYDLPYLHRQMLEVLGIQNASKLVPLKDDQKPRDPVSENMAVLQNKPVKAFIYQDHEAHLIVHMSAMRDPKIMQLVGQNPMAQQIQAAMMAHINEHVAFEYRKQLEEQIGVPYPKPDEDMPEDMEVELSRLAAAGAQKLLAKDQSEAAQQQAMATAQDPVVQMQMQELALKAKELELKQMKLQIDAADKSDRLELEDKRIETQKEIAGMQVGAKSAKDRADLEAKMELEGLKAGMQIAEKRTQLNQPPKKESK